MRGNKVAKITAKQIIDTLAEDGFTWQLVNGAIRAKQKYQNICHCPMSAYMKLVHGVKVTTNDVLDLETEAYGISPTVLRSVADAADRFLMSKSETKLRAYMLKKFGLEEKKSSVKN